MSRAAELLAVAKATVVAEGGEVAEVPERTDTTTVNTNGTTDEALDAACKELLVPDTIRRYIERANDRSKGHQALVRALVQAQYGDEAVLRLVRLHEPSVLKYGTRLDAEVKRSITKAKADLAAQPSGDEDGQQTAADRLHARLVRGAALASLPPMEFLVERLVPRPSVGVIYGPPKTYKSFLTVDVSMHIATGRAWSGREVKRSPVLYVIGEGASGMVARQRAWMDYHGAADVDVYWHPHRLDLMKLENADALGQVAKQLGVGLVVIDTVARAMGGGADESATKDMALFIESLDVIKDAAGCAVAGVHHSGKDRTKGMRGSSALLGAVDWVIAVSGGDGRLRVELEDAKDVPSGDSWTFSTEAVGDSLVLVPGAGGADLRQVHAKAMELLDVLRDVAGPEGLSASAWMAAAEMPPSTFYRLRKSLTDRCLVTNVGTTKQPRYAVGVVVP